MDEQVVTGALDQHMREQIAALAHRAERHDGVPPLSDDALLGTAAPTRHRLIHEGDRLVGYSALRPQDGLVELVVDPAHRRRGYGGRLLSTALSGGARCTWAHGALPAARALASSSGMGVHRRLDCMARTYSAEELAAVRTAALDLPSGWHVRSLQPAVDDPDLLRINAAAFAALPDQAGWSQDDLQDRYSAGWFDPADVVLLCDAQGDPVGFHWTKVHGQLGEHLTGEVYVLAVDPRFQGRGLAKALMLAGIKVLTERGCTRVILYVDRTNSAARHLYEGMGFELARTDVLFCVSS